MVGSLNITGDESSFQFVDSKGNIGLTMGNARMPSLADFTGNGMTTHVIFRAQGTNTSGYSDYFSIGRWRSGTITVTCSYMYAMYMTPTLSARY